METLQLHHIAKRLPYEMKCEFKHEDAIVILKAVDAFREKCSVLKNVIWKNIGFDEIKPILFPLSCLTEPITINNQEIVVIDVLGDLIDENNMGYNDHYINYKKPELTGIIDWSKEPCFINDKLLEFHIDTDGLIEKGLAISVLDLEQNPYA